MEFLQDELKLPALRRISLAISLKLRSLDAFKGIYNRQPILQLTDDRYREPTYTRQKANLAVSSTILPLNDDTHCFRQHQSTFTAVVFAIAVVSFVVEGYAWHIAFKAAWSPKPKIFWQTNNSPGTTSGIAFYLLIQTCIIQLLVLFTTMFPMWRQPATLAWRLAQAFNVLGTLCSIVSIPLYLTTPTIWGALTSVFASAAQKGMILLLILKILYIVLMDALSDGLFGLGK